MIYLLLLRKYLVYAAVGVLVIVAAYTMGRCDQRKAASVAWYKEVGKRYEEYSKITVDRTNAITKINEHRNSNPSDAYDTHILSNRPFISKDTP